MLRAARLTNSEERVRAQDHAHRLAGQAMARAGFGSATHLMVMLMEARGLLTAAKDRGLTTITDVNVALSSEQIVRDERHRNPGWERDGYFWGETLGEVDASFRPSAEVIEKTDIFLCPSEFVRSDLVETFGVARERTILLPYAANPRWFDVVPEPITGRILFAGEAGLRKGIHILAAAAAILKGRGRTYEYRIAGNASETVRARSETAPLTFLGRLGYQAMREEFSRADVFAFPSLSEGSAGVTYEAMGCAVPVVTTNASGSVARDGVEGVIVPEGDPDALADALERIIEDRATREEMARAARRRAQMYSWDTYTDRFAAAILGGTSVSA
ncbi:glycosyltransferase family 4 protein [Sphingorhabdus sp. YGSMI21]|uniref:glycosyltransferase family 4 protein n=1 Tax=Sphingorhabdus sp. YGSMI21 TaxID=2077182 RepID=UPI0013DBDDFA|nr:glycosyltransferase family 4 protein [Sphingorhabdus sp. YGSMI21]